MAKLDSSIHFNGRYGDLIGYQWRGRWCVRRAPDQIRDARSERQLTQRALFKAVVNFAGSAVEVLHVGLRMPSLAVHKTECNYFFMRNKRCFSMENGQLLVDYGELCVSEGPVAPVCFDEVERHDAVTMTFRYSKIPERRNACPDDRVYIAAFNADEGLVILSEPAYRRSRRVILALPEEWAGDEVHLYGIVQDSVGRASDSVYLGNVPPYEEPIPQIVNIVDAPAMEQTADAQGGDEAAVAEKTIIRIGSGLRSSPTGAGSGPPPLA